VLNMTLLLVAYSFVWQHVLVPSTRHTLASFLSFEKYWPRSKSQSSRVAFLLVCRVAHPHEGDESIGLVLNCSGVSLFQVMIFPPNVFTKRTGRKPIRMASRTLLVTESMPAAYCTLSHTLPPPRILYAWYLCRKRLREWLAVTMLARSEYKMRQTLE